MFADDLAIGPDGAVYFSDVSTYSMDKLFYDVMSAGGRGRIIRYDPVTGKNDRFSHCNGQLPCIAGKNFRN